MSQKPQMMTVTAMVSLMADVLEKVIIIVSCLETVTGGADRGQIEAAPCKAQ